MIELRAHHLLCTVLYEGAGYSKEFTDNMDKIVDEIANGDSIYLKSSQDIICGDCPNACKDGSCALDKHLAKGQNKEIQSLDKMVLAKLKLNENINYDSKALYSKVKENISYDIFEELCNGCRWYEAGYCSFDKYITRIDKFIK